MEHRRTRRYFLSLPLAVTRAGTDYIDVSGMTSNISSTGILFTTSEALTGPIEYTIQLQEEGSVRLRCIGNVLRAERNGHSQGLRAYRIAVTLERYQFVRDGEQRMAAPTG